MTESVPLVEKKEMNTRSVNVIEQMDLDPNPNWKCEKGPKPDQCIPAYIPEDQDDYRIRCSKCASRHEEEVYYQEKKTLYEELKYSAHSNGCRNFYQYQMEYANVVDAYEMYVKGTELKPSGDVVLGKVVYGNVGLDFTKYHPEWKAISKRKRDRYYEEQTAKWTRIFPLPSEDDEMEIDAKKLYNQKHQKKEVYNLE
ncbi:6087_t:CDS:1, partial [Paraglomus occultum]